MEDERAEQSIPGQLRNNTSSIHHGRKIQQLIDDSRKEEIKNLSFSRNYMYFIGSGINDTKVYLGLKKNTEVAIKIIRKNSLKNINLKNELKNYQDLNLENKNIIKYVDLAEDKDFYYLADQLCEYSLEEYIHKQEENETETLWKIVKEMLLGLQVLHSAFVYNFSLKPSNVLIDSQKNLKLDYFCGSKTASWEATEALNQPGSQTTSSDIQVAGMLVYYILSKGNHPFGETENCEENIKTGQYSLEGLHDIVAKDLIEWMINKDPKKRPAIDQVLDHPYFWDNDRKDMVLRRLGDKKEVQKYTGNTYLENAVMKHTVGKSFSNWKLQFQVSWDIDKKLPENLLGLLRFLRNKLVHENERFIQENMLNCYQDFFISLHRLAIDMNWEF